MGSLLSREMRGGRGWLAGVNEVRGCRQWASPRVRYPHILRGIYPRLPFRHREFVYLLLLTLGLFVELGL